jgi:hypothetical protein
MEQLGLPAGPLLGRLLREVRLAWEAGEASTAADLVEVAHRLLEGGDGIPVST